MRRTRRARLGAFAGAAALALSIAAVAHAQQAQPDTATLTEAQTAGLRRLKEVIEVLNSGDYDTIRAYFDANSVGAPDPPPRAKPFSGHVPTFSHVLIRYSTSRGLDLVRVTTEPSRGGVVGIVRNRLTGDEEYFPIWVEPEAPHRIIGVPVIPADVVATWNLKRAASVAVTEEERLQEIGSYLKRMGDADIFSGAVVIARDGKPVLAQAYGYADREKKIPNTLDTPFLLGSMSKLFTGLAIGQLVEQGKLGYDDPLAKFLPDFPDPESAKKIRIKHLLSHTSGLGSGSSSLFNPDSIDRQTTVKAMVDAFERKPPAFDPGTKWAYSNMGFVLLGRIIETVAGQDYYDYMQKHVFAPAGAASASFPLLPKDGVAVVPMAYPYELAWDGKNLKVYVQNQLGKQTRRGSSAGGGVASALDVLKLSNAMRTGRIVKPETFRLHSRAKPELGATNYGYGFIAGTYYGRPFVGHNGRASGQCTEFGELRDTTYTIVVLSNLNLTSPGCSQVTQRILRVLRPSEAKFAPGVSLKPHPEGALVGVVSPGGTAAAMGTAGNTWSVQCASRSAIRRPPPVPPSSGSIRTTALHADSTRSGAPGSAAIAGPDLDCLGYMAASEHSSIKSMRCTRTVR
jgi:CubicO group peptidase (beta-lactamase class C family)